MKINMAWECTGWAAKSMANGFQSINLVWWLQHCVCEDLTRLLVLQRWGLEWRKSHHWDSWVWWTMRASDTEVKGNGFNRIWSEEVSSGTIEQGLNVASRSNNDLLRWIILAENWISQNSNKVRVGSEGRELACGSERWGTRWMIKKPPGTRLWCCSRCWRGRKPKVSRHKG